MEGQGRGVATGNLLLVRRMVCWWYGAGMANGAGCHGDQYTTSGRGAAITSSKSNSASFTFVVTTIASFRYKQSQKLRFPVPMSGLTKRTKPVLYLLTGRQTVQHKRKRRTGEARGTPKRGLGARRDNPNGRDNKIDAAHWRSDDSLSIAQTVTTALHLAAPVSHVLHQSPRQ